MNKFLKSTAAITLGAAMTLGATMITPKSAHAADPFIAEIKFFGGNFAPRGWALCQGQLLPISSNTALFSILGTTYGGDGRTTFGLPDLRGRSPVGVGQGPGLSNIQLGAKSGAETATLTVANMPGHSHTLRAQSANGNQNSPNGNSIAPGGSRTRDFQSGGPNVSMGAGSILNTGGGQPFSTRSPYLGLNCIIATLGLFPSRS